MLHAICTHGNRVDSWLLVVGSQIVNLTPGSSFGHNLCFRCPNGQCKPILDIYVPISFHWYKKLFKKLSFDPYNCPLKIWESPGTPTPKVEFPWGVRVHSLTPSHTPESMLCDFRLASWPATSQTLALVVSPRLGLRIWWYRDFILPFLFSKWFPFYFPLPSKISPLNDHLDPFVTFGA